MLTSFQSVSGHQELRRIDLTLGEEFAKFLYANFRQGDRVLYTVAHEAPHLTMGLTERHALFDDVFGQLAPRLVSAGSRADVVPDAPEDFAAQ